jgi:hypothetical protein
MTRFITAAICSARIVVRPRKLFAWRMGGKEMGVVGRKFLWQLSR